MLDKLFADSSGEIILVEKTQQGFRRMGAFKSPTDAEQAANGKLNVYFKINRMDTARIDERNKHGIGGRNEVASINTIGLDLDVGKKSSKYLPREEVMRRLEKLEIQPSIVTETDGPEGGLHVYWILDQPVEIDENVHERSTYYFNEIANQYNKKLSDLLGGCVDNTGQIERLLRPAGSVRDSGNVVSVIKDTGIRYSTLELEPIPLPKTKIIPASKRECSPILDALELEGVFSVEDYLAHKMEWEYLGNNQWRRPDSASGAVSGETFVGQNGELGVTIKTGGVPQLKSLQWYSLPALHVAMEHGGDWGSAALVARRKIVPDPSIVFTNLNDKWERDECTDLAMAIRTQELVTDMAFVPKWKEWFHFDGKSWVPDENNARLTEYILDAVRKAETRSILDKDERTTWLNHCKKYKNTKGIESVRKLASTRIAAKPRDFDADPLLLHCPNVVVDLHSSIATPNSADYKNTKLAGCDYDAHAECPRWMQFLEEITVGNRDFIAYLKRVCGYAATGLTTEEIMLILVGDGSNGKSIFVNTVQSALGSYAVSIPRSVIAGKGEDHSTGLTLLEKARFASTCETDMNCSLQEGQVKALTSTDRITARKMYKDYSSFDPTAKIVLSTNYIPRIHGTDAGIWRRVKLIPFDVEFTGDKKDPDLGGKLRKELPGILRWIVEGAWEYLANGLGPEPECVTKLTSTERKEMDIVGSWLDEKCTIGDHSVEFAKLFADFKEYCQQYNLPAIGRSTLGRRLTKEGFALVRNKNERLRTGLTLSRLISP